MENIPTPSIIDAFPQGFSKISSRTDCDTFGNDSHIVKIFKNKLAFFFTLRGYNFLQSHVSVPELIDKGVFSGKNFIVYQRIFEDEQKRKLKQQGSSDFIENSARFLAKLHTLPLPYGEALSLPALLKRYVGYILVRKPYLQSYFEEHNFSEVLEQYGSVFEGQPVSLIHGDFHSDNLIWNEKLTVLDFDGVRAFDHYFDLCSAFRYICNANMEKFRDFMRAYKEVNPFNFSRERFYVNFYAFFLNDPEDRVNSQCLLRIRKSLH